MRNRWTKFAVLMAAVSLLGGCSSCGLEFPNMADLNPFDDSCNTCAPAAPVCPPVAAPAPAPVPVAAPAPAAPVAVAPATGRPANANAGEVWCYVRIPAVTRTVNEQVCVRPASTNKVWVPEETRQVTEQVCVRPAATRQIPIPAEFRDVPEQVCVAPGRQEWRRVDCASKANLNAEEQLGECWTLAQIPPQYETKTKRVMVRPASSRTETIPAEYSTQTKTVVVRPGYHQDVPVPAQYENRSKVVTVSQPRWEWRRSTECEVPTNYQVPTGAPAPAPAGFTTPAAPVGGVQPAAQPAYGSPDALGAPLSPVPAPDPIR